MTPITTERVMALARKHEAYPDAGAVVTLRGQGIVDFARELIMEARLHHLLHYAPETGLFVWRKRCGVMSRVSVGAIAGCTGNQGYRCLVVDGRRYGAHRVAWFLMTGRWPVEQIDHINGVRDDNRWSNLREVTNAQNAQNRHGAPRGSSTGLLGVSFVKQLGKYRAEVRVRGLPRRYLGLFCDPKEAHAAYLEAKRTMHTHWNTPTPPTSAEALAPTRAATIEVLDCGIAATGGDGGAV